MGSGVIFAGDPNVHVQNIISLLSPSLLQVGLSNLGAATEKDSSPGLSWDIVNKRELLATSSISFAGKFI